LTKALTADLRGWTRIKNRGTQPGAGVLHEHGKIGTQSALSERDSMVYGDIRKRKLCVDPSRFPVLGKGLFHGTIDVGATPLNY
jgi:hypothetical protein